MPRSRPGQVVAAFLSLLFVQNTAPRTASTASLPAQFVIESLTPGVSFATPTAVAFLPGGRLLVAEKAGVVWSVTNGVKSAAPMLSRTNEVLDESDRGLLGIAVDPNYVTNHYIYLLLTVDPDSNGVDSSPSDAFGRLVRYTVSFSDSNIVLASSRTILLGVSWRYGPLEAFSSHTIGALRWGRDGSLLVSAGDGASWAQMDPGGLDAGDFGTGPNKTDPYEDIGAFRAQSLRSLCGKLLRIDPATGAGYVSNPYWDGDPYSVRSRVWAYGMRNPFRFCVRPGTGVADTAQGKPGTVFLGDVGYNMWEELNIVRTPGANLGWPCYEGPNPEAEYQAASPAHNGCGSIGTADNPASVTSPAATWNHSNPAISQPAGIQGNCSIGGAFYTGALYPLQYQGAYFFGDYGQDWLRVATIDANDQLVSIASFGTTMDGPVDFTVDPVTGDLIYVAINAGEVRRIRYSGVTSGNPVAVASGTPTFGIRPLTVAFSSAGSFDPQGDALTLSWLFGDGMGSSTPNPSHTYTDAGVYTAVLTADDGLGGIGRDTVTVVVGTTMSFPTTGILDDFNRANGAIGGAWIDQTAGLLIDSNALTQTGGSATTVWNGGTFGPNQEAYVTLNAITAGAPEHDLMLKVQGSSYAAGHIEVWYDAPHAQVIVSTFMPASGWTEIGRITGLAYSAGDQFGARALADGSVQVFRNGVLRGTVSAANWPFAKQGGRVGLTLIGATASRLDDFGGGDMTLGQNTPPVATILAPADHSYFAAGDTIRLTGSATDAEDPAASLAYHWEVSLHHNNHVHPSTFVSDAQDDYLMGDDSHDDGTGFYYEIDLVVTDTRGAKDTTTVNVYPEIDLVAEAPVVMPESPLENATVGISAVLRNDGRMPSAISHWELLLEDAVVAQGDTIVPPLDSVLVTCTTRPNLPQGTSHVRLVADSAGAWVETNETNNGATSMFSVIGTPTAVDAGVRALALSTARPNPTGGASSLRLALPSASRVDFAVFDVQGREVWRSPSRRFEPGVWDLRWPGTAAGRAVPPGLYLARVRAGDAEFTRRIVRVR